MAAPGRNTALKSPVDSNNSVAISSESSSSASSYFETKAEQRPLRPAFWRVTLPAAEEEVAQSSR